MTDAPPSLFIHATSMYNKMFESAEHEIVDDESEMLIYTGFLTTLVTRGLNLSVPNYTHCRNILVDMGCIRQMKRGGGSGKSIWELKKAPTLADYDEVIEKSGPTARRIHSSDKRVQRDFQVDQLRNRVTRLEQQVNSILKAYLKEEDNDEDTLQSIGNSDDSSTDSERESDSKPKSYSLTDGDE